MSQAPAPAGSNAEAGRPGGSRWRWLGRNVLIGALGATILGTASVVRTGLYPETFVIWTSAWVGFTLTLVGIGIAESKRDGLWWKVAGGAIGAAMAIPVDVLLWWSLDLWYGYW